MQGRTCTPLRRVPALATASPAVRAAGSRPSSSLLLGLLALPGGAAAVGGATSDAATLLQSEQVGTLPGGLGGHFAYVRFAYPGDGWPVYLELSPHTYDSAILTYVGFKVYGPEPHRVYVQGKLDDEGVWRGGAELFSDDRGPYLVQAYNYNPEPHQAVGYMRLATNVPPRPAEAEPVLGPLPRSAGFVAIPIQNVESGQLEANAGGRFRYYSFYAGGGRT
jgi:hypothetical protein